MNLQSMEPWTKQRSWGLTNMFLRAYCHRRWWEWGAREQQYTSRNNVIDPHKMAKLQTELLNEISASKAKPMAPRLVNDLKTPKRLLSMANKNYCLGLYLLVKGKENQLWWQRIQKCIQTFIEFSTFFLFWNENQVFPYTKRRPELVYS